MLLFLLLVVVMVVVVVDGGVFRTVMDGMNSNFPSSLPPSPPFH